MAPEHLAADLVSDEGRRQLRSATSGRVLLMRRTYSSYMETDVMQLQVRNCGTAF